MSLPQMSTDESALNRAFQDGQTDSNEVASIRLYDHMVAGSLPLTDDPIETLHLKATAVLRSDSIHYLTGVEGETSFYIAVPSRTLASVPEFATPLACALPGHPDHKGDGIYLLQMGQYAVAITRDGTSFDLMSAYLNEVNDAIAGSSLPVHNVSARPQEQLISRYYLQRTLGERVARMTAMASLSVIAVAIGVSLVSAGVAGYQRGAQRVTPEAAVKSANAVIESTQLSHPLAVQMEHIAAISSQIVKTGGWIEGYRFTDSDGETFTVSLPTWVTGDTIKALGSNVKTELQQAGSNLIWVRQADRKGRYIADVGPAPLAGTAEAAAAEAAAATRNSKTEGAKQ